VDEKQKPNKNIEILKKNPSEMNSSIPLARAIRQEQEIKGIQIGKETQKSQHLRERMNKWDCITLKSSAQQKKQSLDSRDSPQNGRKSLPATHPIKD
jgi:hypothetical protein